MLYRDRREAGRALAGRLTGIGSGDDVVVLALPRGGVPVAFEVASALGAPLDVFVVRKLGVPGHEELAMGAIASGGIRVVQQGIVDQLGIDERTIERVAKGELVELERREKEFRGGRPLLELGGKRVILVDDGLATGSTMRAAVSAVRQQKPKSITVAVPVAASSTCREFQQEVDEVVCAETPEPFYAVGQWYRDFTQTTDDEVRELLREAGSRSHGPSGGGP